MAFSSGLARPRLKYSDVGMGSKKVSSVSTDPYNVVIGVNGERVSE